MISAAALAMLLSSHCHMYSHHSVFLLNLSLVSLFLEFLPRAVLWNQHKLMKKISYLALEKKIRLGYVLRSAVIHYSKLNVGYRHCALLMLLSETFFL